MTTTNCYCSIEDALLQIGITDSQSDSRMDAAINAASRQMEWHTGNRWWADSTVVVREYYPDDSTTLCIPEGLSTVTGLIVKTDTDDNGTYETTLTISTNFIVTPPNAADAYPIQPYSGLQIVDGTSYFPRSAYGRPTVQVTAKFGWPSVPADVKQACIIQAVQLYKSTEAVFGILGGFDQGVRVGRGLNPIAESLLEGYCRPRVG